MKIGRLPCAVVFVVAATACTAQTAAVVVDCPASPFRSAPPLVIAHGGGEGLGPANTILALQRSLEAGADILDVDLWMTSDGVIVARHDRDLSSSTDGRGNIDETTWADARALDTRGSWNGEPIDEAVPIPSLEQILLTFPDRLISLELKQVSPSMAEPLCRLIESTDSIDDVYISSNEDAAVYAARDACPGLLITTTYQDLADQRAADAAGEPWCSAAPIGQPPFQPDWFTPAFVDASHARGVAIFTWTVDDPDDLRKLAEMGVDGVYTRRPDIARKIFDELAEQQLDQTQT